MRVTIKLTAALEAPSNTHPKFVALYLTMQGKEYDVETTYLYDTHFVVILDKVNRYHIRVPSTLVSKVTNDLRVDRKYCTKCIRHTDLSTTICQYCNSVTFKPFKITTNV